MAKKQQRGVLHFERAVLHLDQRRNPTSPTNRQRAQALSRQDSYSPRRRLCPRNGRAAPQAPKARRY